MGATAGFGVQGVSNVGSAYAESESIKAQGSYQRSVADANAELSNMQANDASKRGEAAVNDLRKATKQKVGAQRAAAAASGVDVGSGSAAQLQEDTALQGVQDTLTIRNNATREAWGFRAQANNFQSQGDFASLTARSQSNQTLINGGMRAVGNGASAWGSYSDRNGSSTPSSWTGGAYGTKRRNE